MFCWVDTDTLCGVDDERAGGRCDGSSCGYKSEARLAADGHTCPATAMHAHWLTRAVRATWMHLAQQLQNRLPEACATLDARTCVSLGSAVYLPHKMRWSFSCPISVLFHAIILHSPSLLPPFFISSSSSSPPVCPRIPPSPLSSFPRPFLFFCHPWLWPSPLLPLSPWQTHRSTAALPNDPHLVVHGASPPPHIQSRPPPPPCSPQTCTISTPRASIYVEKPGESPTLTP